MIDERTDAVGQLEGGLIVSCQALPGDPLDELSSLVALARSAELGGAVGLRIARPEVVAAVRRACRVPIIGITKHPDRTRAYVTPVLDDARALVEAGADIVAVDATDRERPNAETAAEYVGLVRAALGVPVMADISTEDEGYRAFEAGADLVATTLSGFTPYSRQLDGPDLDLIRALSPRGRVIAEGRIRAPEQVDAAFDAGAYAVVVGRAITRPQDITARFAARTRRAQRQSRAAVLPERQLDEDANRERGAVRTGRAGIRYWLGVDGGQSELRAVIVGSDGSIYGAGTASPPCPVLAPGGRAELERALGTAVAGAMSRGKVRLETGFLGLSGVVAGGRIEQAVRAAARLLPVERLYVDSDGRVALAGAHALRPGLVAIAGTGSGAFGIDRFGRTGRAGGWGYLFGDEAGGFGIAREAVRVALGQLDCGGAPSPLAELIVEHLGVASLADVPKAFYAGEVSRAALASMTPKLAVLAMAGDDSARAVFDRAAAVVAEQLAMVAARLAWQTDEVEWAGVGGLFGGDDILSSEIDRHLTESECGLRFVRIPPRLPPVVGAALLAAQLDPACAAAGAAHLATQLEERRRGSAAQAEQAGAGGGPIRTAPSSAARRATER